MSGRIPSVALLVVLVLVGAGLTAVPVRAQDPGPSAGGSLENWKVGALAYTGLDNGDRVTELRDKVRIGSALVPSLEPWAAIRPWVGGESLGPDRSYGIGGILVDVPVGPFVFTPSVGAGVYTRGGALSTDTPVEFRSQLEVGYEFEDHSRFTLGFSRTTSDRPGQPSNDMIGLYFRLPTGSLLGD